MYVKKRLIFSKCQFIDLEEDIQYIYIYSLSYYAMYTSTNLVFLRSIARSDFESSGYDTYKVFT